MKAGYAASGLRAWKEVAGAKTYFLYDGLFPICEINASGSVTATNVYGPDGLIARKTGTTWTYYSFDQQGNLALRTNASGTVLSHHKSDAFGGHWESAANADPFAYNAQSGYYLDRETGLYLCGFRYYDPVNARWLNRDPIGFSGGINLYGYCQQNPVGWVDPAGLWFETAWDATSLVIGAENLGDSVGRGDVVGSVLDGLGLVIDTVAAVLPVVPGGVGNFRKIGRAASAISDAENAAAPIKITKSLRTNLRNCGRPVGRGQDAAHIVAQNDRRAAGAREVLAKFGIDVNDPVNGVAMDRARHQRSHTNANYAEVGRKVQEATSRDHLVSILREIGLTMAE